MSDSTAAGQDDGAGSDPDIAGNVQRSGSLAPLMPHGDIGPVKLMATAQEKDILPHHQVIVDGDNPVEGFEVLADTDLVPDGEVLPAAKIGAPFHNQFSALVGIVFPEHMPANRTTDTAGQLAKDRGRGFGEITGKTVIEQFTKSHIG